MPKAEVGTPKWISNQWKKKGLNKLRWYCGLCKVSCRDANGFQLHLAHEGHLRREVEAAERRTTSDRELQYRPDEYSEALERSFLRYLVRQKLGQRVRAHEVYRAINPDDRQFSIMASTCWETLGRFIVDLRQRGELEAWRDDDGWIVTLSEGAPACDWALMSDADAKVVQSKIDPDAPEPADWRDLKNTKKRTKDDQDVAFRRAANFTAVEQSSTKEEVRTGVFGGFSLSTTTEEPPPKKPKAVFGNDDDDTWLRRGLVVKAKRGALQGRKCVIIDVVDQSAVLESLDDAKSRDLVAETDVETVIPNIGKPVRILAGPHSGQAATLVEVHYDVFSADLRLPTNARLDNVPYEHFCKDSTLKK